MKCSAKAKIRSVSEGEASLGGGNGTALYRCGRARLSGATAKYGNAWKRNSKPMLRHETARRGTVGHRKRGDQVSSILIFFLGAIFGTMVALMVFAMMHLNDND